MSKSKITDLMRLACLLALMRSCVPQNVISLGINQRATHGSLERRNVPMPLALDNDLPLYAYYATVEVGTPPQTLELVLETKSGTTWLYGLDHFECAYIICEGGVFNASTSSTVQYLDNKFLPDFLSGSAITDIFRIGGMTLQNLTMAVATAPTNYGDISGVLGIGFDLDESLAGNTHYPNFMDEMVTQGVINVKAYSIYLNELAASTGVILFGGYDTTKFSGDLVMMPMLNDPASGRVDQFIIPWTSVSITDNAGTFSILDSSLFPTLLLLDTREQLSYIDEPLFPGLASTFGSQYDTKIEAWNISCEAGNIRGSIDFGFGGKGGPMIAIPFAELVIPNYASEGWNQSSLSSIFGLQPNPSGRLMTFGQSFMRSTYTLVDLQDRTLGLAPVIFNSDQSNILEYKPSSLQTLISTDTAEPTAMAKNGSQSSIVISTGTIAVLDTVLIENLPTSTAYLPSAISAGTVTSATTTDTRTTTPTTARSPASTSGTTTTSLPFNGPSITIFPTSHNQSINSITTTPPPSSTTTSFATFSLTSSTSTSASITAASAKGDAEVIRAGLALWISLGCSFIVGLLLI